LEKGTLLLNGVVLVSGGMIVERVEGKLTVIRAGGKVGGEVERWWSWDSTNSGWLL